MSSIDLVGFKQSDDSRCGPSVIKSVLYYYGIDETEDNIAIKCNHTYELGCTNEDIARALESYGFGVKITHNTSIEDLEYWVRHKVPVIVDWFTTGFYPSSSDMANGHSGIVIGVDKKNVKLLDPEFGGAREIERGEFLRVWFDWEIDNQIEPTSKMNIRTAIIPYPKRLEIDGRKTEQG